MSTTYDDPTPAIRELVKTTMAKYRPDLTAIELSVQILMAHSTDDKPTLKFRGYQAAATIQIVSYKNRKAGMGDVLLTLDGDRWETWPDRRQEALILHELTHIEVKYEKDEEGIPTNVPKCDDCGRPKLKIRLHDAEVGVFYSVMDQFGPDAIDTEVVANLCQDTRQWVQPMLDWG